jgi:hypothetical protein
MVDISRVRVNWTGFVGGPGVSTFYFLDTSTVMEPLHIFLTHMATKIPPDVTMRIADSGDKVNEVTGAISGTWTEDLTDPIVGTGDPRYAAPLGFIVVWSTDDVGAHRRIRGKTFFVPASGELFSYTGDVGNDMRVTLEGFAQVFAADVVDNLMVWHRPRGGAGGLAHAVTRASIPTEACILTSRRD